MTDPIPELQRLLGKHTVFVPCAEGSKSPSIKWGDLTVADMTPEYLIKLQHGNIGVALGEVSGGLCAIDCDTDELAEQLLEANPQLAKTLRTHGARGCTFWVSCKGDYPKRTTKLKDQAGNPLGEFRSNGAQSIVWGTHPVTKKEYTYLVRAQVVEIEYSSVKWPSQIANPPLLNAASCVSASLRPCVPASSASCIPTSSASLHNKAGEVLTNIVASKEARQALETKNPNLVRLYSELIEPRFQARAHARNEFIVHSVPFLYCVVAPQFVLELVGCFYDCNRSLFNDTHEQHMKEATAMLESVATTYLESLNADERKIYEALSEQEQAAFRICRDLALLENADKPPRTFFMSFNQLGDRLGIFPMQAQRVMRQLESYGLIKLLQKGTRRAAGVRGEAGIYGWLI